MDDRILTLQDLEGLSNSELDILRYKCQTDLFWLCNTVLRNRKSKPLLQRVHGGICDTLIRKYPTSDYGYYPNKVPGEIKEFEQWSPIKERVILSSRGTLKSTLEVGDVVQIILCEPNVRLMVMSGKLTLAKSILRMARNHFESNEVLGRLFPQWIFGIEPNANEFISPARHGVNFRDPTIQVATFGSTKAGSRADYIKLDDATNEQNQATPESVEKSKEEYDDLDPLIEPGGYIDFTATRWAVDDLPEYIRTKGETLEAETGKKHVIYFFQPIWKVKKVNDPNLTPEQSVKLQAERDDREKNHRLVPDDVDLLWPEKLTAEYLWPQYRKNPRKFACQYLLNPEGVTSGVFTRALLQRQTRPITEAPFPHRCITVINWDLSGISGKGDYAVGACGLWEDTGRLFIIDAIVKKFKSSTEICYAIVNFFKKYNPDFHRIESSNGAEFLSGELRQIAAAAELDQAFMPGFDPPTIEENAKTTRIMLLPGALENDKLQFFSGIPDLEELYKQFELFTGKGKYKDDGPDCIAQMYQKWKGMIGPKAISYLTPSGAVVDFQSPLQVEPKEVDTHADETRNADIEFLSQFTAPHSGQ